jgi:hypothetical protein
VVYYRDNLIKKTFIMNFSGHAVKGTSIRLVTLVGVVLLGLIAGPSCVAAGEVSGQGGDFAPAVSISDLDASTCAQWVDGKLTPIAPSLGPASVVWTRESRASTWEGLHYGESKNPGLRYLRIGFNSPIAIGSVLTAGGGSLSVLKPGASYPGNLTDESQWIPATRLVRGQVSTNEAGDGEYAFWVLPPGTKTRAIRFSHQPKITDQQYAGSVSGIYILSQRDTNIAPLGKASASDKSDIADRLNNDTYEMWNAWENLGLDSKTTSANKPWVMLKWAKPVSINGLVAMNAGFMAADIQALDDKFTGSPDDAKESDWQTVGQFTDAQLIYPYQLCPNWVAFPQVVHTRAIRLNMTEPANEQQHPHMQGKTMDGHRYWLGELMAISPLGSAKLDTALTILPAKQQVPNPPIAINFTLTEPGEVTLVIEDSTGHRVRNLIGQTAFPAGKNTAYWDGADDLLRDSDAAAHGIYSIPSRVVAPGKYVVRGLVHKPLKAAYEFSVYDGGASVPWETPDTTGGWLTNHSPPSAALYVPADRSPIGKEIVYLGSYVAEGGPGLAWVDLDGHKLGGRGWVGGNWTGAPFLALDTGPKSTPDDCVYVGSVWEGDLRLTALVKNKGDRNVTSKNFGGKSSAVMEGIAAYNGLLVCSLPKPGQLLFINAADGQILGDSPGEDLRGITFDSQGRLLVLVGKKLLRCPALPTPGVIDLTTGETLNQTDLQDPKRLTLDSQGNIYVSDQGTSQQIKVFDAKGKLLRTIGKAGAPAAGPYDPTHMNHPTGITIDSAGHLWVTENDDEPKRVSVWTTQGQFVRAHYGPQRYGGGAVLDSQDKSHLYSGGMEFKLDWETGTSKLTNLYWRHDVTPPLVDDYYSTGPPDYAIHLNGHRYWTNCFSSNPTGGMRAAMIWIDRDGVAVQAAAMGMAYSAGALKSGDFRKLWPDGVNPDGDENYARQNTVLFAWSDLNGDGIPQPDEVRMWRVGSAGGVTVLPDLSFLFARVDGKTLRFKPTKFTDQNVPTYDSGAGAGIALLDAVKGPTSTGGDQALVSDNGNVIVTLGAGDFAYESLSGGTGGTATWSYPSLWPGLHASHNSPAPDRPGMIVGTTRLLGGMFTAPGGDGGPMWTINGNMGECYLFTSDGLFVSTLFHDTRLAPVWAMPFAKRNMDLTNTSLHDENFFPSITGTADGKVYVVSGQIPCIVRIDGLDSIHRIAPIPLTITGDDIAAVTAWHTKVEEQRQKTQGSRTLKVPLLATAPPVDGDLSQWPANQQWATIDSRGVAAWFNSNSKPYDIKASVAIAGDRLYAAFTTGDDHLLTNSGEVTNAPFKTGGALDVMIGTNPRAEQDRPAAVAGDLRLLVTVVKGKPLALIYRAVVPGTNTRVPFSSPSRTIWFDQVEDVSSSLEFAAKGGDYEFSIPLSALGLQPQPGTTISADLGVLRGNGAQTLQRVYWCNKATAITADVPSEAELTPRLWGRWQFVQP